MPMNIIELMDAKKSSFSKTDRKIYEGIKKFPNEFATNSITELTDKAEITKSALTRFAQRLGFSGFSELQYQFQIDLKDQNETHENKTHSEIYGGVLSQTEKTADIQGIQELIQKMRDCHAVYILGTNLSKLPAEELHIALSFEDDIISILPHADMLPYQFHSDDILIIYSAISGSSHQELMKSLRKENKTKPYMVLITTNAKHPLRHNFDMVFSLPTASLADSTSNTVLSDTFAFLMFNDILTNELANTKK